MIREYQFWAVLCNRPDDSTWDETKKRRPCGSDYIATRVSQLMNSVPSAPLISQNRGEYKIRPYRIMGDVGAILVIARFGPPIVGIIRSWPI